MAKNPLLNLHILGGTAGAKVIVFGSVGGSGPADPPQTAQVGRTWVIHKPRPNILMTLVKQIRSKGVVLKQVFCGHTTSLVGEQYLAPFSIGVPRYGQARNHFEWPPESGVVRGHHYGRHSDQRF